MSTKPARIAGTVLLFCLSLIALALPAAAQQAVSPDGMARGGLFVQTLPGDDGAASGQERPVTTIAASQVAAVIDVTVSGPVVRTRVEQTFLNPHDRWVEALYIFPLPDNAAIDTLRMVVGDREIEGVIEERFRAEEIYEEAKAEGRVASLATSERPNIFTNAVANIPPNGQVQVTLEYQTRAAIDEGVFSLRFPMTMTPRYIGGVVTPQEDSGTGWAFDTDRVPDASRITPPVAQNGPVNPLQLTVHLAPGFPVGRIESLSHDTVAAQQPDGSWAVTLSAGTVPSDTDFVLEWEPRAGSAPVAGAFRDDVGGHAHLLVIVTPPDPAEEQDVTVPPRDVILVIDQSGSMGGDPMEQAKRATVLAIDRLRPEDRFNVVSFDHRVFPLFEGLRPADGEFKAAAIGFVRGLEADGGTEMGPALHQALTSQGEPEPGRLRQVVFVTDGAVGDEAALFEQINGQRGEARVFMVGIGSAPNTYFMNEAAEAGRGMATAIGDLSQVADGMARLFRAIERPALTDLTIDWPGGVLAEPDPVPDLYAGEPLVVVARLPAGEEPPESLTLTGTRAQQPWSTEIALDQTGTNSGVAKLWAEERIDALERTAWQGVNQDEIDDQIIDLALTYGLITRFTALVAVDEVVSRPEDQALESETIAVNPPAGTTNFTQALQADADIQGTPRGVLQRTAAALPAPPNPFVIAIPDGATPAMLLLLLGGLFLTAGVILLLVFRRRRVGTLNNGRAA